MRTEMEEKLTDKTCKEQALYLLDNLRNRVSTPISRRAGTTIPKDEVAEWVDLLAAAYGHSTRIPRFILDWLEECDDIHLTADYCEASNNEDSDFSKAIKQVQGWKDKKVTCGFLLRWNSQTLAMLPTGRKPGYFQYDIPKGCCEPGETHYETAKRELLEETSIDLRYNIGLSNILKERVAGHRSRFYGANIDGEIKNCVLMLTIGYKIALY